MPEKKSPAVVKLVYLFIALCYLWQVLEYAIYREVQPRKVDNIMAFAYAGAIYYAYHLGKNG